MTIDRSSYYKLDATPTDFGDDQFLVLHDVLYYPDVLEGLIHSQGNIDGVANLILYPKKAGVYKYAGDEGTFEITNSGTVIAKPAGNPSIYVHPVPRFELGQSHYVIREHEKDFLVFVPVAVQPLGGGAHMVQYRFYSEDTA